MEDGFSLKNSTIGIYGLGLMGGSLALALKGHCARIVGFDSDPASLELALSKNIVDQAWNSALPKDTGTAVSGVTAETKGIDLLIIATPVPTIVSILQQLPSLLKNPCIVMDMGSTKGEIVEAMATLPTCFEPIGGHPICGKEKLGLENADRSLYQEAPFVVTPLERTTPRAKSAATQIISAIGAHMLEMSAADHDRILASTSHLPFLISSALTHATPQEFAALAGPGFRSTSRLAGTPSDMMMGILKSNRENILKAIKDFCGSLDEIEAVLQNENYTELERILKQSRMSYLTITKN